MASTNTDDLVSSDTFTETTHFSNYSSSAAKEANLYKTGIVSNPEEGRSSVLAGTLRYQAYIIALNQIIEEWLKTRDISDFEKYCIGKINLKLNRCDENVNHDEILHAYNTLISYNITGHFDIVCSHRQWIYNVYILLKLIGVALDPKLIEQVENHDLSKFGHKEALGYAIMFGSGKSWRTDISKEEKDEWESALQNHYNYNPHHPEYYAKNRIFDFNEQGLRFLDESIIDMLACSGERVLIKDNVISLKNWFNIEKKYLERYTHASDRTYVQTKLMEMSMKAEEYLKDPSNKEKIRALKIFPEDKDIIF